MTASHLYPQQRLVPSYSPTRVLEYQEVECRRGRIGVIRLNRPQALNAVNLEMVEGVARQLALWQDDPSITFVVVHADSERAFCSGGDVKSLALKLIENSKAPYAANFFKWEYKMDHMIHAYAKPVLTWGDAIVMGGGMGIFCGSSHRVVTERSVLAMPEITIGFFPDVGSGLFLNRLPEGLGIFLGWTAARLSAHDALHYGIANHFVSSENKRAVFTALIDEEWSPAVVAGDDRTFQRLTTLLSAHAVAPQSSHLLRFEEKILRAFESADPFSVREAYLAIENSDPWWQASRKTFVGGSPFSAHVTFAHLRRAKGLSCLDVFAKEWSMARHFCEHPDFVEGVRALLIDKDSQPQWQVPSFEQVHCQIIATHLSPHSGEDETREFFALKGVE